MEVVRLRSLHINIRKTWRRDTISVTTRITFRILGVGNRNGDYYVSQHYFQTLALQYLCKSAGPVYMVRHSFYKRSFTGVQNFRPIQTKDLR